MKLSKKQMVFGAGIVVLVGAYLVIKEFFGKKQAENVDNSNTDSKQKTNTSGNKTTTKVVSEVTKISFPIKKGNRDSGAPLNPKGSVVELQRIINFKGYQAPADKFMGKPLIKLVEDGIFGPKTETAVQFWINKKSIDNQMDLNYLKNKITPSLPQ